MNYYEDYIDLILADGIEAEISRRKELAQQNYLQDVSRWNHSFLHRLACFLRKLADQVDIPEPMLQGWWKVK